MCSKNVVSLFRLFLYKNLGNSPAFGLSPRHYRTSKNRVRIYKETKIASPKKYSELRCSPSVLLKGNMFTPESASLRELSMLCYKIVSYGYADSTVLTRYVQCAIDQFKKLKVKGIALILHSVSKYVSRNDAILIPNPKIVSEEVESETLVEDESKHRGKLLIKCIELIESFDQVLSKIFVRAVPKDLGMISLSVITLVENAEREIDIPNRKKLSKLVERLLMEITKQLEPKLPFCEMEEYVGLSKTFSKYLMGLPKDTEWVKYFMGQLAAEISALLLEKSDHLEDLLENIYIGDQFIEELVNLPKHLTTVCCAMSKCDIKDKTFWKRSFDTVKLLIKLDSAGNKYFEQLDIQTLTLLTTSMSKYVNVQLLIERILQLAPSCGGEFNGSLTTCVAISMRHNDEKLVRGLLEHISIDNVKSMDSYSLIQLVDVLGRFGNVNPNLAEELRKLVAGATLELAVALYNNRRCLELSDAHVTVLMEKIATQQHQLSAKEVISLLYRGCCELQPQLLSMLKGKLDQVREDRLIPLASLIIERYGGNVDLIAKITKRIKNSSKMFENDQLLKFSRQLKDSGIHVGKLLPTIPKDTQEDNEYYYADDPYPNLEDDIAQHDCFEFAVEDDETDSMVFKEKDEDEIMRISQLVNAHSQNSKNDVALKSLKEDMLQTREPGSLQFTSVSYPNDLEPQEDSNKFIANKKVKLPRTDNVEAIRNEWLGYRHSH